MKTKIATTMHLEGTSYEVGVQLGQRLKQIPGVLDQLLMPPKAYPQNKLDEIMTMLDTYCPGINEEIRGFSNTVGASPEKIMFYASTYLERGCSLMALMPKKTADGHTVIVRNYDFGDEMEEMCLVSTKIQGKYQYIGSLIYVFGRSDGINECGLAVAQAGNGLPVGNFEGGQKPGVTGFQFWILMRSILENCSNVEEAVKFTLEAPVAFNINVLLADKSGKTALVQCIDGHKAYKILNGTEEEQYLDTTNHTLFEELLPYEKVVLENSVIRHNRITEFCNNKDKLTRDDMKQLFATPYPLGLCCHYYEGFFGTLRTMIFDVTDGTLEMTFGSPRENEWHIFKVEKLDDEVFNVNLPQEKTPDNFYNII